MRRHALTIVLALAAILLAAGAAWQLRSEPVDAVAPGALVVAQQTATDYFTIDHRDPQSTVDAVLAQATGAFAREYADASSDLLTGVRRQRLVTTATIPDRGVAVTSYSEDRARVLVALDVATERRGQPPVTVRYRTLLDLARTDGRWLVADFVEVP